MQKAGIASALATSYSELQALQSISLYIDFQCLCEELTLETQTTHTQLLRHKYVFEFCLFIYFSPL